MGYDAFYFARIDYEDMEARAKAHTKQLLWRGSDLDASPASSIWTVVLPAHYSAPQGFCWELNVCRDPPIMDDPLLDENNVDQRVDAFLAAVDNMVLFAINETLDSRNTSMLYDYNSTVHYSWTQKHYWARKNLI